MNSQTGSTQTSSRSGQTGLKYFLVGSGIGAVAALLFAPKAGSEVRGSIADATRRGYDGTVDLAKKLKEQSTDLYHSLLEGSVPEDGTDIAQSGISTAVNALGEESELASNPEEDLLSITDQTRSTNMGRKSTNIV